MEPSTADSSRRYGSARLTQDCTCRRGRLFQFATKYWFGCSASLVGILWLSQDVPALRPWNPLYVIFTMVVILSEKVLPQALLASSITVYWNQMGAVCQTAYLNSNLATASTEGCVQNGCCEQELHSRTRRSALKSKTVDHLFGLCSSCEW